MKTLTKKEFQTQVNDFLNWVPTETFDKELTKIQNQLLETNPQADEYWIKYWTSRIAFFSMYEDKWNLTLDNLDEPRQITLNIYPTYGS